MNIYEPYGLTEPPDAPRVEEREEYKALRSLVLQSNLQPGTLLEYVAKIYQHEAERLDRIFFDSEMPPGLGFQYQRRIRELKGLARRVFDAMYMYFTEPTLPNPQFPPLRPQPAPRGQYDSRGPYDLSRARRGAV